MRLTLWSNFYMTHDEYLLDKVRYSYEISRDKKFFKKVRAIIVDDEGKIYLLKINNIDDRLYLIGGGVEPNESLGVAIKREVAEETGIQCEPLTILGKQFYNLEMEYNGEKFTSRRVEYYFLCRFISKPENYDMGIDGEFDGNITLGMYDFGKLRRTKLSSKIIRLAREFLEQREVGQKASRLLDSSISPNKFLQLHYDRNAHSLEDINNICSIITSQLHSISTKIKKTPNFRFEYFIYDNEKQLNSIIAKSKNIVSHFQPPTQIHFLYNQNTKRLLTTHLPELLFRQHFEKKKKSFLRFGLPLQFEKEIITYNPNGWVVTTLREYMRNVLKTKKFTPLAKLFNIEKTPQKMQTESQEFILQCGALTQFLVSKYGFDKIFKLFISNPSGDVCRELKEDCNNLEREYIGYINNTK